MVWLSVRGVRVKINISLVPRLGAVRAVTVNLTIVFRVRTSASMLRLINHNTETLPLRRTFHLWCQPRFGSELLLSLDWSWNNNKRDIFCATSNQICNPDCLPQGICRTLFFISVNFIFKVSVFYLTFRRLSKLCLEGKCERQPE